MFADLDRSEGTRDAPSLTRLVTQFLDKLSSVMTHAPPPWLVRCGKWRRVGGIADSPLRCASLERLRDGLAHSPRMSLSGTQICGLVTVELLHARESGL